MPADGSILDLAIDIAFVLIMAAAVLAFVRLVRGPSLPDRVVALDLITILAVAFSALFAIAADEPAYLDVAIALALVAFLATVAFARFAERRVVESVKEPPNGEGVRD
ncbi:MAG: cation:proton antiporter [Alphaproteobacteria bacterium]|nr:cation:proton antiporter [Alphaproteobacteria bacterium]